MQDHVRAGLACVVFNSLGDRKDYRINDGSNTFHFGGYVTASSLRLSVNHSSYPPLEMSGSPKRIFYEYDKEGDDQEPVKGELICEISSDQTSFNGTDTATRQSFTGEIDMDTLEIEITDYEDSSTTTYRFN